MPLRSLSHLRKEHVMRTLLSIAFAGLFATAFLASDAHADSATGVCNAIVATDLGAAQMCQRLSCIPGDAQCMDVTNAFIEFATTPGCLQAFANGELKGVAGPASIQPDGPDAGAQKHVADVICEALEDCGLCPSALMVGLCGATCTD